MGSYKRKNERMVSKSLWDLCQLYFSCAHDLFCRRCKISLSSYRGKSHHSTEAPSTSFKVIHHSRKNADADERNMLSDLALLIGANLSGDSDSNSRALPFAVCKAVFPAKSTQVVLSFLESRFHGVVFMAYKKEEGRPSLDNLVFGATAKSICNHPMAMRVRADDPVSSLATSLIGFDLRLVKDFAALPTLGEDGKACYDLRGPSMDIVVDWWTARNSIKDRLTAFTGVDSTDEVIKVLGLPNSRQALDGSFVEGGKNGKSSSSPKLTDADALTKSKAVIVDLGNACWTHRHFSEDIQTRQYRAPEVLIGSKYDTSADMWSLGCMTFELLTGDLLFDPRAGEDYDRDEDHLAMFQELLGKMPKKLALDGKYSKQFFDKRGNLKHIKTLKFWPIKEVLVEKYHFSQQDAQDVSDFMEPLLDFDPKTRWTALAALQSRWLRE